MKYPKEEWNIEIDSIETWSANDEDDGGIQISWSSVYGFGQFQFYLEGGRFHIADDEYMGAEFVQEVFNLAVKLEE